MTQTSEGDRKSVPAASLQPDVIQLLLLLLLSCFTHVRLCAAPQTAAHQAPPSLGFSRQGYWSGLPFPSPIHACMLSCFSHVWLYATLWTAAHQAPLSTGFSRQEYWRGLPFPSPATSSLLIRERKCLKIQGLAPSPSPTTRIWR